MTSLKKALLDVTNGISQLERFMTSHVVMVCYGFFVVDIFNTTLPNLCNFFCFAVGIFEVKFGLFALFYMEIYMGKIELVPLKFSSTFSAFGPTSPTPDGYNN
uniref:Uncharacterized protein n=1 Tax=Cacopsylla melanoneura TaxID=428564 RepID=A0A8D8WC65_9HEMI